MPMPITREQMEQVLSKGNNAAACVQLFAGATEDNRRELAPVALAWYRAVHADWNDRPHKSNVTLPSTPAGFLIDGVVMAVLATATWTEIKRLPEWHSFDNRNNHDLIFDLLSARKPKWIDDWAEAFVAETPENWTLVRRLNRAGIGNRSDSDACISGMLASIDRYYLPGEVGIRDRLLEDPELLDQEVWRLFEVQQPNGLNFAARDGFRNSGVFAKPEGPREGWVETFVQFARDGRLSRSRLLEASLSAIEREFPEAFSRWFPKFHEALEPTAHERREFLPRYWALLRSRNPSSVTFVLDVLQTLDAAGDLPDEDAIEHLPLVLLDKTKARAKLGLKLLDRIAKRHPDLSSSVALATVVALSHEAADVQEAGWKLIEKLGSRDLELETAICAAADSVAAALRDRVQQWLSDSNAEVAVDATEETHAADDLIGATAALPPELARVARIPELLAAIAADSSEIPTVDLQTWSFPRLREPIAAVASLDDLIDTCATALESIESADEVERIFDGISRWLHERPDDFEQRTSALKKRTLTKLKTGGATFIGDSLIADLYATIWAWLTGEVSQQIIVQHNIQNLRASTAGGESWIAFPPSDPSWLRLAFSCRAKAIAERAVRHEAMPLLSAPTHAGGWIDSQTLIDRVITVGDRLSTVPEFDQALSLLRLAPDGRHEALARWFKLQEKPSGEYIDAMLYSFGVDDVSVGPTAALWCAAARARSAWADDPRMELRHPKFGPDCGQAVDVQLKFIPATTHPGKIVVTLQPHRRGLDDLRRLPELPIGRLRSDFELPVFPDPPTNPLWLLHEGLPPFWMTPSGPLTVRWAFTVWPASAVPQLPHAVFHLKSNIDWERKLWANRVYLQSLLPTDVALTPIAILLVVIGLVAKEPGEAAIAIDVIIAAIGDGRLNGEEFGAMLKSVLSTGLFKVVRWATSLKEIARPSIVHAEVTWKALAIVFSGETASDTRDLAQLLELLHQLTLDVGQSLPVETTNWLQRFQGTGKAAKGAKALLAAKPTADAQRRGERNRLLLRGRIERVRRWMTASESE